MVLGQTDSVLPRNFLGMQNLRLLSRPTDSEAALQQDPWVTCMNIKFLEEVAYITDLSSTGTGDRETMISKETRLLL